MSESAEIIDAMRRAVPAGRARLSEAEAAVLRELTAELIAARPQAADEYARFRAIADRGLCLPEAGLSERLGGATVLVTGGTGCIGSALVSQLAAWRPARLVSVSRGITDGWPRQPAAAYRHADITDPAAIADLINELRPDVVFHVAAQRSPALAEAEVHRTASANVLGVRNVLAAAAEAGVRQVVCASTGKALRPYSPEIYTASKRAAEWVASTTARASGMLCSAARFTHVIDNSIVHERLAAWAAASADDADDDTAAIRLHSADIGFYVQSALESAQLLLLALLGAEPGEFRVHAISDLGWPVSLLDVALGVLDQARSRTPLYISGYDPGYEEVSFPGLYDPATAGDVSPLLNAFEAAAMTAAPCPRTDSFRLEMTPDPAAPKLLRALDEVCARPRDDGAARQALDDLSWSLLDATLAAADPRALARCANLVRRHEESMSPVHRRITQAIKTHADRP
ncbi:MAG: polysaccharide biosynthesis protein [Nocardiopsaceae bacterium]|nr:polysaccharide biosynthesis protein [Nocardiopsaceae bacterium]